MLSATAQRNRDLFRSEALEVLQYNGVPPERYPSEIGLTPGTTSYYYHRVPGNFQDGTAGNIYQSEYLADNCGPITNRKVGVHEPTHLVQELVGRDMTDHITTELEAEAWAIDWMKWKTGQAMSPPPPLKQKPRPTPMIDLMTIKSNPIALSTCITPGISSMPVAPGGGCSTFKFTDDELRRMSFMLARPRLFDRVLNMLLQPSVVR